MLNGGGVRIVKSSVAISNSTFSNNLANDGASISIDCSFTNRWENSLTNVTFENNIAAKMGGAIYYNLDRPNMTDLSFKNNSALYGNDIASYGVRIALHNTTNNKVSISDVPSGLIYNATIKYDLLDYDNQVMNLNNKDTIKITASTSNSSVKGTDFAKFYNGKASFNNLYFVSKAGDANITYTLTSNAIDSDIISQVLNKSENEYSNILSVTFR